MTKPIAVTGATGHIGGAVARDLAARGLPLVLIVRDASRAPQLPDADVRVAEYRDHAAMVAALESSEHLLLVSGHEARDRLQEHRTAVDAARAAGVKHVVYTSFVGASADSGFTLGRDHGATEDAIRAAGLSFTFLRDNFYLDLLPEFAGEDGVIRGPAGDGLVAAVARADVAEVAALVLADPAAHSNVSYDLTGREALTFTELAQRVSAATAHAITFHDETVPEAYASRAHYGAAQWQLDAWVSTYTAIRDGELEAISPDVERLTGHRARVLEDVL